MYIFSILWVFVFFPDGVIILDVVPRQKYCESLYKTVRRNTRTVMVGNVALGSEHPIRIQTMTTTDTKDVAATVEQVLLLSFCLTKSSTCKSAMFFYRRQQSYYRWRHMIFFSVLVTGCQLFRFSNVRLLELEASITGPYYHSSD